MWDEEMDIGQWMLDIEFSIWSMRRAWDRDREI